MPKHRPRLTVLLAAAATPAFAQTPPPSPLYRDAHAPLEARVNDLLPRLSLQEKIALLHGAGTFHVAPLARFHARPLWMSDGPQGVREEISPTSWNPAGRTDDFATAMPADIGLAASFDVDLARQYGSVIGEEARARGKNIMLGPAVNIMRTPLNGRNSEYFGEDPFLAARMAVNYIEGIQSHGVAACVKHFAANNQETRRNSVNVLMDDRALHEIYLPAFKAAVTEAHVWAVMAAYNKFRGDYCSENDLLLNQILKHDWQFPGIVISDWGGTHSTINAALHGLDLEMGTSGPYDQWHFAQPLLDAVHAGQVPESRIDEMARRNLRVMFATGLFDDPSTQEKGSISTPAHYAIAERIQESACVLLKNQDALLPLDAATIHSIAVIGANADTKFAHDGNSAAIKTAEEITPLAGLRARAGSSIQITYSPGYAPPAPGARRRRNLPATAAGQPDAAALIATAVDAARHADVAVIVAGLYRRFDQEGADRPDMQLPPGQADLIQAVLAANPHTIVILTGGGPVDMSGWIERTPALIQYWYGGSEGGAALARILFGDVSPSGKLPCTFPKHLEDSPAHALHAYPGRTDEKYAEGLLVGYRWFDTKNIAPLFPFGFGLSYTTFSYANLRITPGDAPGHLTVSADITNTGHRPGAEAAQLYIHDGHAALPRPEKELKAFAKPMLRPGETKTVTFSLTPAAFSYYDPATQTWTADPGSFTILVGASSRDIRLQTAYQLTQKLKVENLKG